MAPVAVEGFGWGGRRKRKGVAVAAAALSLVGVLLVVAVAFGLSHAGEGDSRTEGDEIAESGIVVSDILADEGGEEESAQVVDDIADAFADDACARLLDVLSSLPEAAGSTELYEVDAEGVVGVADRESYPAVAAALDAYADYGYSASFFLYDCSTGWALASNVDRAYFCASTVKAPFCAYVSEDLIDSGAVSDSDVLWETELISGTGDMASDGVSSYELSTVIEKTIVLSDNTGYRLL